MGRGGSMGLQGRELGIKGAGWQYGVTGKGATQRGGREGLRRHDSALKKKISTIYPEQLQKI